MPVRDKDDLFGSSENFDMCLDPWANTCHPSDPYHWKKRKAASSAELFPANAAGTSWAQQIEGRHPVISPKGQGRYSDGQWYSMCDGSASFKRFDETYLWPDNNQ